MQTLIKKAALAVALTLSLGTVMTAQAAQSLGTLSGTNTYTSTTTNGSFADLYNFTVSANTGSIASSLATAFSNSGAIVTSISLYEGTYATASALTGHTAIASGIGSVTNLGGGLKSSIAAAGTTYALSTSKTYTLVVNGTSKGTSTISTMIALAPVPEPETYAMLLAGLGMMGFIARRRSQNNKG